MGSRRRSAQRSRTVLGRLLLHRGDGRWETPDGVWAVVAWEGDGGGWVLRGGPGELPLRESAGTLRAAVARLIYYEAHWPR